MSGYVVPIDDELGMAERVVALANSPLLRRRFGDAGRQRVEQGHGYTGLAHRLLATYRTVAERQQNRRALQACLSCVLPTVSAGAGGS